MSRPLSCLRVGGAEVSRNCDREADWRCLSPLLFACRPFVLKTDSDQHP